MVLSCALYLLRKFALCTAQRSHNEADPSSGVYYYHHPWNQDLSGCIVETDWSNLTQARLSVTHNHLLFMDLSSSTRPPQGYTTYTKEKNRLQNKEAASLDDKYERQRQAHKANSPTAIRTFVRCPGPLPRLPLISYALLVKQVMSYGAFLRSIFTTQVCTLHRTEVT